MKPIGRTILKLVGPTALWRAFPQILSASRIPEEDFIFFERVMEFMSMPLTLEQIRDLFVRDAPRLGIPDSSSAFHDVAHGIIIAIRKRSGSYLANPLNIILDRDLIRYDRLLESLAPHIAPSRMGRAYKNTLPKDWLRREIAYHEGQVDPLDPTTGPETKGRAVR